METPIQHRLREYNQRQKNIDLVQTTSKLARDFIANIRGKAEELRYHTEEELEGLSGAVESVEKWMSEQVAAQKKLSDTDEPVLLTSKVAEKVKQVEENLMKLLSKKKPKAPKKEPVVPKNETEEEETAKNDTESAANDESDKTEVPVADKETTHDEL